MQICRKKIDIALIPVNYCEKKSAI